MGRKVTIASHKTVTSTSGVYIDPALLLDAAGWSEALAVWTVHRAYNPNSLFYAYVTSSADPAVGAISFAQRNGLHPCHYRFEEQTEPDPQPWSGVFQRYIKGFSRYLGWYVKGAGADFLFDFTLDVYLRRAEEGFGLEPARAHAADSLLWGDAGGQLVRKGSAWRLW